MKRHTTPPEWLDDPALQNDLTDEEFTQLKEYEQAPPDQRRVIIRGWDEASNRFRPRFFYEPSHDVLVKAFQAMSPVIARATSKAVCACEESYTEILAAIAAIESGVACFTYAGDFEPYTDEVNAWTTRDFMSMQDAATQLSAAFSADEIPEAERLTLAATCMAGVKAVPLPLPVKQEQLDFLEKRLTRFKALPDTPPASDGGAAKRCPVCRQKYRYSFWELLLANDLVLERLTSLLLGCKVLPDDLPVLAAALEEWFAEFMESPSVKKKSFQTSLAGIFLTELYHRSRRVKDELLPGWNTTGRSDSPAISEDSATDSDTSGNASIPLDS